MMRILILGDFGSHLTTAAKMLLDRDAYIKTINEIEEALHLFRSGKSVDLILMDINYNIPSFIQKLEQERIHVSLVACSIGPTDNEAVSNAIRAGAKEYLPLPPDADLIAAILESISQKKNPYIFQDPLTKQAFDLAKEVANSQASILITGESGTGKEIMARFIREHSPRKKQAFISINCAAIPENLLESELFGHEKGAFTGAVARRIGKFEEANGGTLLLDEISEMHPQLQAKLLRAIQENEIDRVGGTRPVPINIRLLATSNRNLIEAVHEKSFRKDLYFRLNVVNIHLPPLRKRPKDIKILADFFIKKYCKTNHIDPKKIAPETLAMMEKYDWPGNVRELENTMHRAILLCKKDVILPEHLRLADPEQKFITPEHSPVGSTVAEVEKRLILDTLSHCLGDSTHAAHMLGISVEKLRKKLDLYDQKEEPPTTSIQKSG